jgi:ATP-dependent protease ClpP protease subunit
MLENLMVNEYRDYAGVQDSNRKQEAVHQNNDRKNDTEYKNTNRSIKQSEYKNPANEYNNTAKSYESDSSEADRNIANKDEKEVNVRQKKEPEKEAKRDEEKSNEEQENEKLEKQNEDLKDKKISEYGQTLLENGKRDHKIHLLSVIGEIEGHECLPQHNKTTKYEHVLPQLAAIEDSDEIDGLLILINTVGGDVEAGLAIAEMIASLSKPTVSLVLGGSHSIGVPLAVSADYSYIVPSATMIIHPVRMNGMIIGVTQTFEYFEKIQDRIIKFVVDHSKIDYESFRGLMLDTNQLAKDVGSILVGVEAVEKGIIDEVGGIKEALTKISDMIDAKREQKE